MKCPSCNTELLMTERQSVEIDYCPSCRGIWLDRGELDKLLDRSRQEPRLPIDDDSDDDYRRRMGGDRSYPDAPPLPPNAHHYPKRRKSFWTELFDFD